MFILTLGFAHLYKIHILIKQRNYLSKEPEFENSPNVRFSILAGFPIVNFGHDTCAKKLSKNELCTLKSIIHSLNKFLRQHFLLTIKLPWLGF